MQVVGKPHHEHKSSLRTEVKGGGILIAGRSNNVGCGGYFFFAQDRAGLIDNKEEDENDNEDRCSTACGSSIGVL